VGNFLKNPGGWVGGGGKGGGGGRRGGREGEGEGGGGGGGLVLVEIAWERMEICGWKLSTKPLGYGMSVCAREVGCYIYIKGGWGGGHSIGKSGDV